MKVTRFDPSGRLVRVPARIWGRHDNRRVVLAVDTAASETLIKPEILDDLGYSPREGEAITTIRCAVAREPGYLLRVVRFQALGFAIERFLLHAHDLPEGFEIDGLLGLSFLKHFDLQIKWKDGKILARRVR